MLYTRKWKGEKAHPFKGCLEVFAQSASGRHWVPISGPNGQIRSWNLHVFSLLSTSLCGTDLISLCLENDMIPDLPRCSRHEILWFSPDTLFCLQWTKKGYRAYSRLYLWSQSARWAGCLVSWLFIIPLFLQAPSLPCQCVMTVSLLGHATMVKWVLADRLKGLYCSGMYGSDKESVREVLLTGLLVRCCDRGRPV